MKRHRPDHLTNQIDMRAWKPKRKEHKLLAFSLGVALALVMVNLPKQPPTYPKPQKPAPTIARPTQSPSPTVPAPLDVRTSTGKGKWTGYVSHYSRSGCLGCSATLTMANGETLDDNRATIAFNWLPMNTRVRVTNTDNGKSIEAIVTDTGGFNRLNRIADLVPAVANYLETKTDRSLVIIEQL